MGLRELAGEMARNTSGMWRGVADALDPDGRSTRTRSSTPPEPTPADADEATIDLVAPAPEPGPGRPVGPVDDANHMVVPLDTWTRILEQVGNVHEAGQQLAEARERAARAETENRFLKEQLAALKTPRRPPRKRAPGSDSSAAAPAPATAVTTESRVTRARRVASGWLSP